MADEPAQAAPNAQATPDRQLLLQKIYIKDLSFESPKAPDVFRSAAQANTQLNVQTKNRKMDDEHYEVALTLTVDGYDFPMQFWVQAAAHDLRIEELPVRLIYNGKYG